MYETMRRTIEMGHHVIGSDWPASFVTRLVVAWRKGEQRRQLAALDDRLLRDIGLCREDVLQEVAKGYRD